jgi:hypothetical protein
MKDKLIPVGCNRLLGSPRDVSIQVPIWLCSASSQSTRLICNAKRPNARIQPPGINETSLRVLRMKDKLYPVGWNELFGGTFDVTIQR